LGEHPFHRELVQQVRPSERLPGRQRQLAGTIDAARAGGRPAPLLVEQLGSCPTPTTRQPSGGDRHPNFYGTWDNLPATGLSE